MSSWTWFSSFGVALSAMYLCRKDTSVSPLFRPWRTTFSGLWTGGASYCDRAVMLQSKARITAERKRVYLMVDHSRNETFWSAAIERRFLFSFYFLARLNGK